MAMMTFSVGAELDVATGGELADSTNRILKSQATPQPIRMAISGYSGVGSNVLEFGRPPVGRTWMLNSLTLVGTDAFTTVASGLGALYIGDDFNPMLTECRIPALPIPSWSKANGELWAHSTEQVFILMNAQATAVPVTAILALQEWREADVTASFNGYSGA